MPIAVAKQRRDLIRRAAQLDLCAASAPPYETYEWHLVDWTLAFDQAAAVLRGVSPRVCAILPYTMLDADGGPPLGRALAAMPIDVLSTDEVLTLSAHRWALVRVRRVWPGAVGDPVSLIGPDDPAHLARADRTAERARAFAWTYYRSTGWGFVYPRKTSRGSLWHRST